MFERKGLFLVPAQHVQEDQLYEIALEAGADDVKLAGKSYEITCDPANFETLSKALQEHKIPTDFAEISRVASNTVELDVENSRRVLKLLDALEENDDVQSVTSNFNIPDDVMEAVSSGA
jgi:transcriptional/translational regulatory protein YebC/TACO1